MVEQSPWPLVASFSVLVIVIGLLKWFSIFSVSLFIVGFLAVLFRSGQWWRDVSREGFLQGKHTSDTIRGLRIGIVLFIVSEVCFFF